jgi:hypothetical protein
VETRLCSQTGFRELWAGRHPLERLTRLPALGRNDDRFLRMFRGRFDWKQPYRWRTNLRIILPGFFGLLLVKGGNCEEVGASHDWYNIDNEIRGCYHCQVRRDGQLWKGSVL